METKQAQASKGVKQESKKVLAKRLKSVLEFSYCKQPYRCIMETIFKELAIGNTFTMKASDFDLGKVYRKMGNRVYNQIDKTGGLQGPRLTVGSVKAKVFKL